MDVRTRVLLSLPVLLLCMFQAVAGPAIQSWTLGNGARVFFVESHELPLVQARAVFDAGSARDPVGREGLAMLTAGLLDAGTTTLGVDGVAEGFERIGAEFGAGVDRDMATVTIRSLSDPERRDPAFDQAGHLIRGPAFPEAMVTLERDRMLIGIRRALQDPGEVSERAFWRGLYGAHPYAHDSSGDETSVRALARDDLVAFHRRHYVGRNAIVVLVGDATRGEAERLAHRLVGGLPSGEAPLPLPGVPDSGSGDARSVTIPFPASQTHLLVGQTAIRRGDPDYFPLMVGNYTLGGGGLVSLLTEEVREKRGLSYSAYSYFHPLRVEGPFTIGLQTRNAQVVEARDVTMRVVREFVAKGPSNAQITSAKRHLTGAFALKIDSNAKIADNVAAIAFYGLPLDYLDTWIAKVEAVTAEDIRASFRRHVRPERMFSVTVGGDVDRGKKP